jgi:hypothetical protein
MFSGHLWGRKCSLYVIFFFLLTGFKSDSIPDSQLISSEPELTWNRLYVRFRWLKTMHPASLKLPKGKKNSSFERIVFKLQRQISEFFSKNTIEAFPPWKGRQMIPGCRYFFWEP